MTAAFERLCGLVLRDGRRWGDAAVDFQVDDAHAVLDVDDGARWHFLTRPRGGSKTTDLAGVAVAALMEQAPARARCFASATDAAQAGFLIDAIGGFRSRTPGLDAVLRVETRRAVYEPTGASLEVVPADAASAYGAEPYFVVIDELAVWSRAARELWVALVSGLVKTPTSRLVCLTSAGDPAHWSHKVLEQARTSPRWRVREVPGPLPWVDADVLEAQAELLTESQFARLHHNVWTAPEDRLTSADQLARCVRADELPLEPSAAHSYVIGVDLGLKHDRTAAVVAHVEGVEGGGSGFHDPAYVASSRVVVDRLQVWQGTRQAPVRLADVEDWLAHAAKSYLDARVVFDPWQAAGSVQRLRARGVGVEEFTFSAQSVARLAQTLYLLLRNAALSLPADDALLDELANVRLRETAPGVVRLDHDADRHDDRAIAVAIAATTLLEAPRTAGGGVSVEAPFAPDDFDRHLDVVFGGPGW